MCLFPKLIKNPKYLPSKRNGGNPPPLTDRRKEYVPVACGKCIECCKQKALQWRIRMNEELKVHKYAYYYTLTFSNQELRKLRRELHMRECNAVAGKALRRFLERWRRCHKKSLRHWFITELGHENTERIHMHGIIFSSVEIEPNKIQKYWKYGNVDFGGIAGERCINYVTKYVCKLDTDHKGYVPEIFCSSGIGDGYVKKQSTKEIHLYREEKTNDFYRFNNGTKVALPIYYRNKLFTEEQREELWVQRVDKHERYVMGNLIENVNTKQGEERYFRVLKKAQEENKKLGYGDNTLEWKRKSYNITSRMLNTRKKILKDI